MCGIAPFRRRSTRGAVRRGGVCPRFSARPYGLFSVRGVVGRSVACPGFEAACLWKLQCWRVDCLLCCVEVALRSRKLPLKVSVLLAIFTNWQSVFPAPQVYSAPVSDVPNLVAIGIYGLELDWNQWLSICWGDCFCSRTCTSTFSLLLDCTLYD